jgi:hypothetical protein
MTTSRGLSSDMQAMAVAADIRPLILVEALFDSNAPTSYLYLWNGIGNLSYDSKTYVGAGNLLSISAISENVELRANGINVRLSGITDPLLAKAKTEDYQGRELTVKLGGFDSNDNVISSPTIIFSGFMDTMTINESGETATITVAVENRLIEFEKTRVRRYTDNDQRIDYPNDDGLEYVSQIQEKEIVWGNKDANPMSYDGGTRDAPPIPSFLP